MSLNPNTINQSSYVYSICAYLVLSVSSSSWCLGRDCDCGIPWTFLLPFLTSHVNWSSSTQTFHMKFQDFFFYLFSLKNKWRECHLLQVCQICLRVSLVYLALIYLQVHHQKQQIAIRYQLNHICHYLSYVLIMLISCFFLFHRITKTCLFKYTENFTTKKWKFSDKKF